MRSLFDLLYPVIPTEEFYIGQIRRTEPNARAYIVVTGIKEIELTVDYRSVGASIVISNTVSKGYVRDYYRCVDEEPYEKPL